MSKSERASSAATHLIGMILLGAVAFLVRYFYQNYMISGSPASSQWQLGFGLLGGALVVCLIVFPLRRRLRLGAPKVFELWMIPHAYWGLVAGIILLHHGFFHFGFDLRGILLFLLMLSLGLGAVLIVLRQRESSRRGDESSEKPTWTARVASLHLMVSVLTGLLLVIHVLFDAVVRQ